MSPADFQALCVLPACTLRDALVRMDSTAHGILLVLREDGTLRRTLTDGDLRRAMLGHRGESEPLSALPDQAAIVVREDAAQAAVLALMDEHQIDHVPVLNAGGYPVDMVFRRELSQRIWLSSPHLGDEETAFVEERLPDQLDCAAGPARGWFRARTRRVTSASAMRLP
jgi:CBS-domain-containing membrane protein